jgi:hypothetical protein
MPKNVAARHSRIRYTPARLRSAKIHSGSSGCAERASIATNAAKAAAAPVSARMVAVSPQCAMPSGPVAPRVRP